MTCYDGSLWVALVSAGSGSASGVADFAALPTKTKSASASPLAMSLPITSATTGKKVLVATFDLPAPFSSGVASELQVVDCAGGVEGAQFCPAHSPAAGGAAVMRADSSNCGCGRGYR